MNMLESIMRVRYVDLCYFYLVDVYGDLIRVNPWSGMCQLWHPSALAWSSDITYHNVADGGRPLSPFYGPLSEVYYREVKP